MACPRINDFTEREKERLLDDLNLFVVIQKGISEGGFGVIDKARIVTTGQYVSMKRIKVSSCRTDQDKRAAYESIVNEFKFMCRVSHPALQIAAGLYNPEDWENVVLVTPFCENGSLAQFVKSTSLNLTQKILVIFGVCHAMKTLHENGIVHRDLKPGNVLLNDDMYPVVTDFGVSRSFTDEELLTTFAGTVFYMAPEILQHLDYNTSVDVYSFGLLIYEIVTEKIPYGNMSLNEAIRAKCAYRELDIPKTVPRFLADLIRQCNKRPEERPSFDDLCTRILIGYNSIRGLNVAIIDKYKQELMNAETFCYTTFKVPRTIAELPHSETWDGSSPVLFNELTRIADHEGDHPVIFVMVLGHYQMGKSTYLRALTGNAAFYPGRGIQSTTKGILLDGPYQISQLIDRIPDDIYGNLKDRCRRFKPKSEPSIYFVDSQGIGDEKSEQVHKDLFERITSLFAAVSLVCLTVTKFNDPLDAMKTTLAAVRRAQLISTGIECSRLLVMVRGYREEINTIIAEYDEDVYKTMVKNFRKEWRKEHEIASDHYFRGLLLPLPLGNVCNDVQSYMTTVWESLAELLKAISDTSPKTPQEMIQSINALSFALFDQTCMELMADVRDYQMTETDKGKVEGTDKDKTKITVSDSLRHCYGCCMIISEYIASLIASSRDHNVAEVMDRIDGITYHMTKVILPYVLGSDDIPSKDFHQYAWEISEDVAAYITQNENFWKKMGQEIRNGYRGRWGVIIGMGVATGVTTMIPVVGWVVGPLIGVAANAGWWGFWATEKKRIQKIKNEGITMMYPELWERNLFKKKSKVLDISSVKSPPSDRMCMVYFEGSSSLKSGMLVKSLMGVSDFPDHLPTNKVYLFKGMKVLDLLKRFSRTNDKEIRTKLPEQVDFLYVGYSSTEQLNQLARVLGSNTFWITSQLGIESKVPQVHSPTGVYVFTITEECFETVQLIYPQAFVEEVNRLTSKCRKSGSADQSVYLPVYSSCLDFSGPWANVSLRYACRYIFGDEELHKLQTSQK